jgi:hypothetical protein
VQQPDAINMFQGIGLTVDYLQKSCNLPKVDCSDGRSDGCSRFHHPRNSNILKFDFDKEISSKLGDVRNQLTDSKVRATIATSRILVST